MSEYVNDPSALLVSFPYSLKRDDDKAALAEVIAGELVRLLAQTDCAAILPRVDKLPEGVLDILAYDLKVDWYELDAPIWNKRQAIKECMLVHKYKGTKYAVETALHSMYNSAEVKEWFEYGGEPFHFTVKVYGSTSKDLKKLYLKIQYAKNLRSVMDKVDFVLIPEGDIEGFIGAATASYQKTIGANVIYENNDVFTIISSGYTGLRLGALSKKIQAFLTDTGVTPSNVVGNYNVAITATRLQKNLEVEVKL